MLWRIGEEAELERKKEEKEYKEEEEARKTRLFNGLDVQASPYAYENSDQPCRTTPVIPTD